MTPLSKSFAAERRPTPLPGRASVRKVDAPQSPAVGDRSNRSLRFLYFASPATMLFASALAYVGGETLLFVALFAVLGVVGIAVLLRAQQLDVRRWRSVRENSARNQAEIESLSDKMWELRESQEHFRGLIDALGDIVIHRDRAGCVVFANKVFADLIEMDQAQIVGRKLTDLGIDFGLAPDAAFARGEYLRSTDVEIRTRKGSRWFSWIELSARDAEMSTASHRAIARDITDRKIAEAALIEARQKAEYASQAKSRFLATVSHEIRTPMNGIAGMAKLLSDTRLSPEQKTYVSAVSTSAGALIGLIEDLLDFAKIEAGRLEADIQRISPRELADGVVELLASRAYDKGIGLGCHVAANVPVLLDADPGKLRQVMLNLVGNAIKFTAVGGVQVSVTSVEINGIPLLQVSVTDSGTGISVADRERIFEEFEQGDGTSTRGHGGVGLGLAISRRLVISMGGTIRVNGEPGKGSVFTFTIPIVHPLDPDPEEQVDLSGQRLIILAGNAAEAIAIAATVESHGGSATMVSTAREAAKLVRPGDTILVDAIHSESAAEALRHRSGQTETVPRLIVMIAPQDRVRLPDFKRNGFETFLARPVRSDTLVRVLSSALEPADSLVEDHALRNADSKADPDHGLSVLVAEDNDINALLARAALTKAGHTVEVVKDGGSAVAAAIRPDSGYDVVLMDLHMPVMDGLDAISAIRKGEADKAMKPLPIIVLSADGQETTRRSALAAGANGFIAKPLDPDALVRAVRMHSARPARAMHPV